MTDETKELLEYLKLEEIQNCSNVADDMLSKYESAENVPALAVKEALMRKFGFMEGTHEQAVAGLAEDVYTMMYKKEKGN